MEADGRGGTIVWSECRYMEDRCGIVSSRDVSRIYIFQYFQSCGYYLWISVSREQGDDSRSKLQDPHRQQNPHRLVHQHGRSIRISPFNCVSDGRSARSFVCKSFVDSLWGSILLQKFISISSMVFRFSLVRLRSAFSFLGNLITNEQSVMSSRKSNGDCSTRSSGPSKDSSANNKRRKPKKHDSN